jgi:hypothetical protein
MLSYCLYIETVVAASCSWWDGLPGGWTCKYGHQSKVGMRMKPTTEGGKTMMFHMAFDQQPLNLWWIMEWSWISSVKLFSGMTGWVGMEYVHYVKSHLQMPWNWVNLIRERSQLFVRPYIYIYIYIENVFLLFSVFVSYFKQLAM